MDLLSTVLTGMVAFGVFSCSSLVAPPRAEPFSCALPATVAPANRVRAIANPMIRPLVVIFVFIFGLSILDMSSGAGSGIARCTPRGAVAFSCLLLFARFISVSHRLIRRTLAAALAQFLAEAHPFLPCPVSMNLKTAIRLAKYVTFRERAYG